MRYIHVCLITKCLFMFSLAGLLFTDAAYAKVEYKWMAKVVSVQGDVQAKKKDESQWKAVTLNETYHIGDMIRI